MYPGVECPGGLSDWASLLFVQTHRKNKGCLKKTLVHTHRMTIIGKKTQNEIGEDVEKSPLWLAGGKVRWRSCGGRR